MSYYTSGSLSLAHRMYYLSTCYYCPNCLDYFTGTEQFFELQSLSFSSPTTTLHSNLGPFSLSLTGQPLSRGGVTLGLIPWEEHLQHQLSLPDA